MQQVLKMAFEIMKRPEWYSCRDAIGKGAVLDLTAIELEPAEFLLEYQ